MKRLVFISIIVFSLVRITNGQQVTRQEAIQAAVNTMSYCVKQGVSDYAQEKGFLTTFSEEGHSWSVTDALETYSGDFVICSYDRWGNGSLLLKISAEGDILSSMPILAADTILHACRLLQMPKENDGELVVSCLCTPIDGSSPALQFIRFDEDLNITSSKRIPCTFFDEANGWYDAKFLMLNTSIFATLTSRFSGMPNSIFLTQFDFDGNLLNYLRLERDTIRSVCNLFPAEDERIGLFGHFDPSHMGFLTIDTSLQLISRDSLFQWSVPVGNNGDFCHYSILDMINSQAARLSNGSVIVSARLFETMCHANGYTYYDDRSVVLAKYENDFHQPDDMLVIEHMNDSVEYPAFFRSMDFRETSGMGCEVYQCSILNEHPELGLLQPYPTGIVVTKTDQDLNVEWKRRFLRDGDYQAMVINVTADGGCLVAGSVGDYQAQRFDVFAMKINADGTVGLDEVQEENMAFVYPNPAKETVRIGGVEAKETLIYNALGQCVMRFKGNEANVEKLLNGIYLMRIDGAEGKLHTLRLVVNR